MKKTMVFLRYLCISYCCSLAVYAQDDIHSILSPEIHCLIGQNLYDTHVVEFLGQFDLSVEAIINKEEVEFDYSGMLVTLLINRNDNTLNGMTFDFFEYELAWPEFEELAHFWGVNLDYEITKNNCNLFIYDEFNDEYDYTIYASVVEGGADHLTLRFVDNDLGSMILYSLTIEKFHGSQLDICTGQYDDTIYSNDPDKDVEESESVKTTDGGEDLFHAAQKEEILDFETPLGGEEDLFSKTSEKDESGNYQTDNTNNTDRSETDLVATAGQGIDYIGASNYDPSRDEETFHRTSKNESNFDINEYIGDYKNGKPHGYGTMIFPNPENRIIKFIGYFEDGIPQSPGQIFYKNGDRYEGKFNCDDDADGHFIITTREINGKQHYANGDYYEGRWKDDAWHYSGTLIKKNGDRYVGSFNNGRPDGRIVARINGVLSVHEYDQGRIDQARQVEADIWFEEHRPHENTDSLLQQYALGSPMFDKGCMFGDCENGMGISYYGHMRNIYYGPHINGKPNGIGEMFSWVFDETTFKGPFRDGEPHGMIRRENRTSVFLDRIFYEGKIEHGWYNSMEEFESILAKELEEIERDFASRPPGVVIEYIYSDDNDSETEPSWRRSDYDACLSDNCENGYAVIAFGNGDSFMGEMKNGLYHGEGHLTIFATGYSYYGQFADGALHGEGALYDRYRNRTVGRWEYNELVSGSAYNSDGCKVYDGIYYGGKLTGTTFRSSTCFFDRGESSESIPDLDYSTGSGGGWTQETIDYNKGTKDEWSITVPVWKK